MENFANLFYKYNDSFVPIFDGKINDVVKEIKDIKKRLEKVEELRGRVEKLEREKR